MFLKRIISIMLCVVLFLVGLPLSITAANKDNEEVDESPQIVGADLLGDLDNDKQVTASDARIALRASVGLDEMNDALSKLSDVDFDDIISAADARLILRAAVGLEILDYYNYFDRDTNGIMDCVEKEDQTTDTDADGLSDYFELVYAGTNPISQDSDGNGLLDFDEDPDEDSLINGKEQELGSNPLSLDSDNDGLPDKDEVELYFTYPDLSDTDADGASDKWEIDNGFDPLSFQESFSATIEETTDELTAIVKLTADGETAESVTITPIKSNYLIDESIPGCLGSAFEFYADGDIGIAKLSFEFSPEALDEDAIPTIYCLNEDTQTWYEYETIIEGNVATAQTTHFSKYILLDKNVYDRYLNDLYKIDYSSDSGADSNNDGISDYITKLMCDGLIRTGTGTKVFGDYTYEQIQANDDIDGDGIKNGEEVSSNYEMEVPDDATYFNGHYYKRFDVGYVWDDAEAFCESIGGYLATITSDEEQVLIKNMVFAGEKNSYWLGGRGKDRKFSWITGEDWTCDYGRYNNATGSGYEDCLMIYRLNNPMAWNERAGMWNDLNHYATCGDEPFFGIDNFGLICEWGTYFAKGNNYTFVNSSPIYSDSDRDGFVDLLDPTPLSPDAYYDFETYIKNNYANKPNVTILINQPVDNNRIEKVSDVGHSFLRVDDGKGTVNYIGFYPNEFSFVVDISTVLNILTRGFYSINGGYGDDSNAKYDLCYTSEITQEGYEKIVSYVNKNKNHLYNIQNYNCTTFAIKAFATADPGIKKIISKHLWTIHPVLAGLTFTVFYPYGYSPADAGQDVRAKAKRYCEFEKITLRDGSNYKAIVERKNSK